MRWQLGRRSENVEDRSGIHPGIIGGGAGTLVLALIVFLMGGDPTQLLMSGASTAMSSQSALSPEEQAQQKDFVAAILGSTEDVWGQIFEKNGATYRAPKLVLFSGAVESACGMAQSAMGPFYCPLDHQVYLDLSFFHDLAAVHDAPGDFARAYVVAHEIGHHVQQELGIMDKATAQQQAASREDANAISVRIELQADCFAGVWGHYAGAQYNMIEPGDIEAALNAAQQIGDDRLEQQAQGYVVPDSFTHGTSEQRMRWFKTGYDKGRIAACDTFAAPSL